MVGNKAKQKSETKGSQRLSLQVQAELKRQIYFPCKYIWKTAEFLTLLWALAKQNWITTFKDESNCFESQNSLPAIAHRCLLWTWLIQTSYFFFPSGWHFCFKNYGFYTLILHQKVRWTHNSAELGQLSVTRGVLSTKKEKKIKNKS